MKASRLMKTIARQGSRFQAKETWQHRHELGLPWDAAAKKAATNTLLWAARRVGRKHSPATRRRASSAALKFTGWKPKSPYGVEKQ